MDARDGVVVRGPQRDLLVYERDGYRCFCFADNPGLAQGARHLERPLDFRFEYLGLMTAALAAHPRPRRVLSLGLGAGALPRLVRAIDPAIESDTVEIDAGVVAVARAYFDFRPDETMRLHTADARDFCVAHADGRGWDVVFVDCYDAQSVPPHLADRRFLRTVARAAGPDAVVAVNLVHTHPVFPELVRGWRAVLAEAWLIHARRKTNRVLFGPVSARTDTAAMLARAAEIDERGALPFSLLDALARATPA
ncbi:MAG: fused MFS/spermidine synthase [Myxococcales bacterium]|nr:fused MFS/spermidine synthase [Myxococcales bacterium]